MSLNPDKTYMVCRAAKLVEKRRIRAKVGGSNPPTATISNNYGTSAIF